MNLDDYNKMIADSAARFAKDTGPHERSESLPYGHIGPLRRIPMRPHELTVLRDDGLYRHLRFCSPDTSVYWFELVTVPGSLIFQGDGDSYVWRCQSDMFEFFSRSAWKGTPEVQYWAEKLTCGRGNVRHYDREAFEARVRKECQRLFEDGAADKALIGAVEKDVLGRDDIDTEEGAYRALAEFSYGGSYRAQCICGAKADLVTDSICDAMVEADFFEFRHRGKTHVLVECERRRPFQFGDFYEWSFREYDWWYLWACQAIVWGIARYNGARAASAVAA